jgi:hypothetical protein
MDAAGIDTPRHHNSAGAVSLQITDALNAQNNALISSR